jgi:hypothetical protein
LSNTSSIRSIWVGVSGVTSRVSDEWIQVSAPVEPTIGVRTLWLSFIDPARRGGRYGFPLGEEQEDVELCKVDAVQFE